jgi:hypothetical protein
MILWIYSGHIWPLKDKKGLISPRETVPAIISKDLRQMSSGRGAANDKNIEE